MSRRVRGGQVRLRKALDAVNGGRFQLGFDLALAVLKGSMRPAAHDDAAEIAGFAAVRLAPEPRLAALRELAAARPGDAEILVDLGGALCEARRFEAAEAVLRDAMRLTPDDAMAMNNLGQALLGQDRFEAAESCFRDAAAADATHAGAFAGLGAALEGAGRLDEALEPYRRAVALRPELRQFRDNLEKALRKHGTGLDERERMYRSDLANDPDNAAAASRLAALLHDTHRTEKARQLIDAWLHRDPPLGPGDRAMFLHLLSEIQFEAGDFAPAWENFAARPMPRGPGPQLLARPRWTGEPVAGKTVYVWSEQGIGDEIMFATMLPALLRRGARVVVETVPRLVPLFQRSFPDIRCVATATDGVERSVAQPDFGPIDFQVPFGDLGRWLFDDFRETPPLPFLKADAARSGQFRQDYLSGHAGERLVGVAWNSVNPLIGAFKSLALPAFAPVLKMPGHRFIDLQYGDTDAARAEVADSLGVDVHHDAGVDQMADLDAFAAQIAALDCVVSVSNTTVHMAAALGVPVFLVLGDVPMWRWGAAGEGAVWYRDLRIFRSADYDDWPALMAAVAMAISESPRR